MPTKTAKLPSQSKLREDFTYNAGTGDFTRYDGKWGWVDVTGYVRINYEGVNYGVHRLIWKWWYGYTPDEIDHINGDGLDNRIDNLRNVDHKTNIRNSKKYKNNTSGFTGVIWIPHLKKWQARVNVKKRIIVGYYTTSQEAKQARDEFIEEFYPTTFSERHGT